MFELVCNNVTMYLAREAKIMPQQLPLRVETTSDIIAKACDWIARQTAPLGNEALGYLIGHATYMQHMRTVDEAARSGDVSATKAAARVWCEWVKAILAERASC